MSEHDSPESQNKSQNKSQKIDCTQFFDKADDPQSCKCRGIVLKTFDSLVQSGVNKTEAIKVASNVLRYHHPCPSITANTIVECWVHKHVNDHIH